MGTVEARLNANGTRDHSQRGQLSQRGARGGGSAGHRQRCTAISPGAATGSSCAAGTGRNFRSARVEELTDFAWRIRQGLEAQGITGANGGLIDHIELFGPPTVAGADSKNFVLCPGKAYDRSPCGTGTSAKLACLYADGKLQPGQMWRQESIVGSVFEGTVVGGGRQDLSGDHGLGVS